MTGNSERSGSGERGLRRQLRWAYAINVLLAVVLVITLVRARSPTLTQVLEGPAEAGFQAHFDTCFEGISTGEAKGALSSCEKAAELAPGNLNAVHNLGFAYRLTGNFDAAIVAFEKVLAEDPLNVRSLYELANAYAEAGRKEEARAVLERLLQVQPDHGWARVRLQELDG